MWMFSASIKGVVGSAGFLNTGKEIEKEQSPILIVFGTRRVYLSPKPILKAEPEVYLVCAQEGPSLLAMGLC